MPEQRARAVEILSNNEQKFNMQIISGVSHGFAVSLFFPLYAHYICADLRHRRAVIPMTHMRTRRRRQLSKASPNGLTSGYRSRTERDLAIAAAYRVK